MLAFGLQLTNPQIDQAVPRVATPERETRGDRFRRLGCLRQAFVDRKASRGAVPSPFARSSFSSALTTRRRNTRIATMSDLKFRGYAIKDEKKWTEFDVIDFECVHQALLAYAPRTVRLAAYPLAFAHSGRWHGGMTWSTSRSNTAASVPSLRFRDPILGRR